MFILHYLSHLFVLTYFSAPRLKMTAKILEYQQNNTKFAVDFTRHYAMPGVFDC